MDINHILSGLRCSAENQQHMALALSIQYLDTCNRADTGLLAPSNSTSQVDRVEFRIMSLHQFYFQKSCKRHFEHKCTHFCKLKESKNYHTKTKGHVFL